MATKDWLPALVLGALVAGAGLAWDATHPAAPVTTATNDGGVADRWVFVAGPILPEGESADLLVIRGGVTNRTTAVDAGWPEDTRFVPPTTTVVWRTPDVGFATVVGPPAIRIDDNPPVYCDPGCHGPQAVQPDGAGPMLAWNPTFGSDGHFAVQVTYFVFLENGKLLASNAQALEEARFDLDGDFVHFEPGVLWLGDGQAPAGTNLPPEQVRGFTPIVRDALDGMPRRAIVSRELVEHPGKDLFGTVYLTVRIDEFPEVAT